MELTDIAALSSVSPVDRLALPPGEAIYFLLDKDGVPLYIGATVHLKDRLGCHRWLTPAPDSRIDRIAWKPCAWPASEFLEAELIFKYKPVLNVRGKRVKLHPETRWPVQVALRDATLDTPAPPAATG